MATDKTTREIEIIANGQKFNASLKEMTSAQSVLNAQIYKMSADDPKRAELIQQYQELKKRTTELRAETLSYKQTQEELAAAHQKVHEENLKIISDGKSVTASLNAMKAAAGVLEKQLSELSTDDPNRDALIKDYQELNKRIGETTEAYKKQKTETVEVIANGKKMHASLDDMKSAASALEKELSSMSRNDPNRAKLIKDLGLMKTNIGEAEQELGNMQKGSLGARLGIQGVTSATGLLKIGFQAAVAAFLPLLAFQTIVDLGRSLLGLVDNVDKVRGSWQSLGVTQTEELDLLYTRTEAFSKTFGKEHEETIKSANVLAKEFGISNQEAFDLMEKGFLAGGDASGEMLDQIKEYSVQFATAGASAEDFVSELVKGEKAGIFSDKAADVVKEFGLRIREQTKPTVEALDAAFGQGFTDRLTAGVNSGKITTVEALKMVSAEMNKTGIPAKELQTVIADVFGGPGEDAGIEYLRSLKDMGGSLDGLIDQTSTLTSYQMEQLAAEKELAYAQVQLGETFSGTGATLDVLWTNIKTIGLVVLNNLVKGVVDVKNQVLGAGAALSSFGSTIANAWGKLMDGDLKGASAAFNGAGKRSAEAFNEGYYRSSKQAKVDAEKLKKQEETAALTAAQKQAEFEALVKTANLKQLHLMLERETDANNKAILQKRIKFLEDGAKLDDKRRKEAAAAMKKAREEFNQAEAEAELELAKLKVDIMQDGIDKAIAKLRLQFTIEDAELEKRKQEIIANAVATETEKNAAVALVQEQQVLRAQELADAERAARDAQKEKDKEEAARTLEEKLAQHDSDEVLKAELEENKFLNEQTRLEDQTIRALEAEQARDMALLELKKTTAAAKLADLEAANQGESAAAVKLKNDILRTDKEIADGKIANARKTAEMKAQMVRLESDNFKFIMDVGLEFFAADEASRKKNAGIIKAFTAGKIIADLMTEISGYMAHPASVGTFGLSGTAKSVIAAARAGIALEQVRAQTFATGGMTGRSGSKALINMVERGGMWEAASGYSGGSLGSFAEGGFVGSAKLGLIGERGAELVIPNWMISSPKYANTVGWLESERVKGATAFAEGGLTANGNPAMPSTDQQQVNNTEALLRMMVEQMASMNANVMAWPKQLQVHNNVGETQEKIRVFNDLVEKSSA